MTGLPDHCIFGAKSSLVWSRKQKANTKKLWIKIEGFMFLKTTFFEFAVYSGTMYQSLRYFLFWLIYLLL